MVKFKIKAKENPVKTPLSEFETMYQVESEGFEADVIVFQYKESKPFINDHFCKKGGDLLWTYGFWTELQNQVIFHHLNENEKEKIK